MHYKNTTKQAQYKHYVGLEDDCALIPPSRPLGDEVVNDGLRGSASKEDADPKATAMALDLAYGRHRPPQGKRITRR